MRQQICFPPEDCGGKLIFTFTLLLSAAAKRVYRFINLWRKLSLVVFVCCYSPIKVGLVPAILAHIVLWGAISHIQSIKILSENLLWK
jgi:hypothetical protein